MTNPACPYCGTPLAKLPVRKIKCPACSKPIHVKSTPNNRTKRIMTETQAQEAESLWAQRGARISLERIADMAPVIGLDSAQVLIELRCAPNSEGAWESILSLRAVGAENQKQRSIACGLLAEIKAKRGESEALGLLRDEALFKLKDIAETAAVVPGMKVQIRAGLGARTHEICRAMDAEPVALIEEEMRNPRLPNPLCPAANGSIETGYCTCRYVSWKADWKIDRSPRR